MRTMYDAVTPANIPLDAQMVAGYVDGRYAWKPADWARFPSAVHVRIAAFPQTNDGTVLDIERGDATPEQGPGWVLMRRAAGVDPSVYCSLGDWASVRAAFDAANVAQPHYWIAAYPGIGAALYDGAVAHQHTDAGPYDLSVVADHWPGIDPPITTGARAMTEVLHDVDNERWATQDGPLVSGIPAGTVQLWIAENPPGSIVIRKVSGAEFDDRDKKGHALIDLYDAVAALTAAVKAQGAVSGVATLDQVRQLGKDLINGTTYTSHID